MTFKYEENFNVFKPGLCIQTPYSLSPSLLTYWYMYIILQWNILLSIQTNIT